MCISDNLVPVDMGRISTLGREKKSAAFWRMMGVVEYIAIVACYGILGEEAS